VIQGSYERLADTRIPDAARTETEARLHPADNLVAEDCRRIRTLLAEPNSYMNTHQMVHKKTQTLAVLVVPANLILALPNAQMNILIIQVASKIHFHKTVAAILAIAILEPLKVQTHMNSRTGPVPVVLGVAALGVAALGVAALGVAALGVAALGVAVDAHIRARWRSNHPLTLRT
jgi:hypothetical protein